MSSCEIAHCQSYANYNPIDRELRRRIFWLMMGGDKSKAVLMGRCPIASDALYTNVALPSLMYVASRHIQLMLQASEHRIVLME